MNLMTILSCTVCLLFLSCTDTGIYDKSYDLFIHGGVVIDGTGTGGYRADILVKEGMIVYTGEIDGDRVDAREVIDAGGMVVAPGFIDAHAHGNPMATPDFRNFLAMGVTTITLGQDGSSPTVGSLAEWMEEVNESVPGVNIALFVGHGTIRQEAGIGYRIDVNEQDLENIARLVEDALEAGCFGLSTGLEYEPGSLAGIDELVAVAEPVGRYGGLVMSHMRSEDDDKIEDALEELLTQGLEADSPVHVSHIKITYGKNISRAEAVLARMEQARRKGLRVTADLYPYTASYTGIGIVFPDWAKPPFDYDEVVMTRREELAEYLRNRIALRNGPEATLFGTEPWVGMTLAEVAGRLNKPFEEVLIDDIGLHGASAAYFVMSDEVMERFLVDPYVMICSDGSPTMHHPRGYGTFARVIRKYVNEKNLLTLEEAVFKMTGLTAGVIGLDAIDIPRGYIKPNFAADLVIFNPERVTDSATYEEPHRLAEGFDFVIVNGIQAIKNGKFTGERSGVILKSSKNNQY